MNFNQSLVQKNTPVWLWVLIFIISISGTFYLGLNPELINKWWWILATYNSIMSLLAAYYIYYEFKRFKYNVSGEMIGAKFTWSFVKIIPVLVIVPVLSFYIFSFQSIQDNVASSEKTFNAFNNSLIEQVDGLHMGIKAVRDERYTEQTKKLLTLISSFASFKKDNKDYKRSVGVFLQALVEKNWACKITLFDKNEQLIATTKDKRCQYISNAPNINKISDGVIEVKMSSDYVGITTTDVMIIYATYATEPNLTNFLLRVEEFSKAAKNIKFSLNTSVTQKRFIIDFSSTILLTLLSSLMVVMRMIQKLIKPLNDLSFATREIASGNYGVSIKKQKESGDIRPLIDQFNIMSQKIKTSREGLDTHNLYLETILKYSYGVIALDASRKIRLINPVVKKILNIEDEQSFIGKKCSDIAEKYQELSALFKMTKHHFTYYKNDWSEEIEVSINNKSLLLSCQGATLDKTLGYVIVIKDISTLHKAQKKAAWGEVARRMAHEIKNPLSPILLSAGRLRERFIGKLIGRDLEIVDKTTQTIITQVKSMDKMVSAFANYANAPQISLKERNLNNIIKEAVTLFETQENIKIKLSLDENTPNLLLDASSISRVLINLLKNSTESVDETRHLEIKISSKYLIEQQVVELIIADNGPGFNKNILSKVFEPYVSSKNTGSGLGMAIVQNIIEQHGGQIEIKNITPHGAMTIIKFKV